MTREELDQIKRDAEHELVAWGRSGNVREASERVARHCLALLAALEQADRERDEAQILLDGRTDEVRRANHARKKAEARLSAVPALVEAVKLGIDRLAWIARESRERKAARAADEAAQELRAGITAFSQAQEAGG